MTNDENTNVPCSAHIDPAEWTTQGQGGTPDALNEAGAAKDGWYFCRRCGTRIIRMAGRTYFLAAEDDEG